MDFKEYPLYSGLKGIGLIIVNNRAFQIFIWCDN